MEEHSLLIAEQVNKIFGPVVAPLKHAFCSAVYGWFGKTYVPAEKIIPDHVVFAVIIFLFCCIFFPLMRRSTKVVCFKANPEALSESWMAASNKSYLEAK